MGKTWTAFLDHCQDMYGPSVLHCLVTVYFNMQENCLEDPRIAKYGAFINLFCAISSNLTVFMNSPSLL